jgi:hypothetical protein
MTHTTPDNYCGFIYEVGIQHSYQLDCHIHSNILYQHNKLYDNNIL